jgi:hypothetical protein
MIQSMNLVRQASLLLMIAVFCASCGEFPPSPTATPVTASPTPAAETPTPTNQPAVSPTIPVTSPSPSGPSPTPPYGIEYDDEAPQEPGTIWFGDVSGPRTDNRLEPLPSRCLAHPRLVECASFWPRRGITYEALRAFGAFWGEPVDASRITISLYRLSGDTLDLVWSDVKDINPDAVGYFDDLAPFTSAGTYRLEVTRGPDLLASGVAHLGPRCKQNCSGG